MEKNRYDYPIQGERNVNFPISIIVKGKKEIVKFGVSHKQANIEETIKFLQELEKKGVNEWLFGFLKEFGDINDKLISIIMIDQKVVNKIYKTIIGTRFRGLFKEDGDKKRSDGGRQSTFGAIFTTICNKLCCSPNEMLSNHTIEQFNRFAGGINYAINEMSDEGKVVNDRESFNAQHSDDELIAMFKK